MAHDDDHPETSGPATRSRRERSTRYPGVPLAETLKLCESVEELGVDGLPAADIASALGYTNIKTNAFSARLSAARQFGLLELTGEGYALTGLAREILHPVDPETLPELHRRALLNPPLYADLAERYRGKRVPEAAILGNVLYHNHQIIASAKQSAAESFLESSRFAGALGNDSILKPEGLPTSNAHGRDQGATTPTSREASSSASPGPSSNSPAASARRTLARSDDVRIDLRLWNEDEGKMIRVRAPQSISRASYERFLQAFGLLVRVEEAGRSDGRQGPAAVRDE